MFLHWPRPLAQKSVVTWKRGQDAGVGTGSLGVFRGIFGLDDLVEVEKFPVPPVDQILAPSFGLDLNDEPLDKRRDLKVIPASGKSQTRTTYKVVDETFLLLNVGDDGADGHIVRQLFKIAAEGTMCE